MVSLLSGCLFDKAEAQGTNIQFGKNRVQLKDFNWRYYRTDEFDIYYYGQGKDLARFVGRHAKKQANKLQDQVDYRARNRITFMIYNSYGDLRQTNIGYTQKEDNPSGKTPIVSNHAFLYFNGNHFDLLNQMREALSRVLLNEMLYGGSIQERVQNSTLLNLPDWYLEGLTDYFGKPMSMEKKERLKSGVMSGRFKNFQHLPKEDQTLISQAIWKYIADVYGESTITNIIYLNKVNKSLESGFVFVLGKDYNDLFDEWYEYARQEFKEEEEAIRTRIPYKNDLPELKDGDLMQIEMSPAGDKVAYVTNQMGKKKVWIYDFSEDNHEKIYQSGYKTNLMELDKNYPLISWRPVQNQLTIVDEKESVVTFMQYEPEEEEIVKERKNFRLEKVLDFSYSDDGRFIALSVVSKGNSDIYFFNWQTNSLQQVTKDIYDDLNPEFADKGNAIVFSSNRASDTLIKKRRRWKMSGFNDNFDVFYVNYKERDKNLKRLTFTNAIDELHPNKYNNKYFSYLTPSNGVINRDASRLDSIFKYSQVVVTYEDTGKYPSDTFYFDRPDGSDIFIPDLAFKDTAIKSKDTSFFYKDTAYTFKLTNRPQNIISYNINKKKNQITEFYREADKVKYATYPIPGSIPSEAIPRPKTDFSDELLEMNKQRRESPLVKARFLGEGNNANKPGSSKDQSGQKADTGSVDINDYYFQSEFTGEDNGGESNQQKDQSNKPEKADQSKNREKSARRKAREKERELLGDANPYFLSFTPTHLQTQLDNSIINTKYLPYNQDDPEPFVYNPVMNMMFTMGVSDLFEDYRITGGVRVLGNLRGADYFFRYKNLKNRLDQKLTFFRHGEKKQFDNGSKQKQEKSHGLSYQLKWPFSEKASIRGEVFGRRDNTVILASERNTLEEPNDVQNFMGINLSYVFDNTRKTGKNLKAGTRLKLYMDGFRSFKFDGDGENQLFSAFGGDFRNYIPIFRDITWANRLSFASSFGQSKVVYFMGGVDNWLFPQFNEDIQVSDQQNYVYKSLATNLRGFSQNIRNGNSYSVLNTELRIPIFRMFHKKPIMSSFFKDFQIIGFGDVGSAWTGQNPFGEDNALNRTVYDDDPYLDISVINLSNPIVGGAGFGFRATLLGYFVRFDHAWGFENYSFKDKGMTYLSIGMDF